MEDNTQKTGKHVHLQASTETLYEKEIPRILDEFKNAKPKKLKTAYTNVTREVFKQWKATNYKPTGRYKAIGNKTVGALA